MPLWKGPTLFMKQTHLECGRIINTHGFRGTVKLESYCDAPEILAGLSTLYFKDKEGFRPVKVRHASVFRQFVLADLEGVDSEEKANRLRNTVAYAAREDLPIEEGDHFIVDLIGLPVKHADTGKVLGTLTDVKTQSAVDLYVVRTDGGEHLVPAVSQFVIKIDCDDAVYIRPIPGLLDGGAENV